MNRNNKSLSHKCMYDTSSCPSHWPCLFQSLTSYKQGPTWWPIG